MRDATDGPASSGGEPSRRPVRLLDHARLRHCSPRTEEAYVGWIRRFILFHRKRHPAEMGAPQIAAFLSWLAVRRRVSASTQNQALSAILFLYRVVLGVDVGAVPDVVRARRPALLPVVLTREEVAGVLKQLDGVMRLIAILLYGAGLRLSECLELRVKDLDFPARQVLVRGGKGRKDRVTVLPASIEAALGEHLERVRRQHDEDLRRGLGRVVLPEAIARKYPAAACDWRWQFVFPAARICRDPRWGPPARFHLHESAVQRAVAAAVRRAGVQKRATCHTFRPFVCHPPAGGRL